MSTFTKGEQMSKVLNELGTQCAVYGNHEFGKKWKIIVFFAKVYGCTSYNIW